MTAMTRSGMILSAWFPIQFALLSGCSTYESTVDESAAWGSTGSVSDGVNSAPLEADPGNDDEGAKDAPSQTGGGVTDQEILERWASWCIGCGNDLNVLTRTAEDVMQGLAAPERAARIFKILTSAPLTSGEVDCLLKLIAATKDPQAVGYISTIYGAAQAMALRKAGSDEAELFVSNETNRIKAVAVESGALLPGPEALALVLRGAQDSSTVVRQAAAIALAKRSDFTDKEYIRSLRDSLDPAQRPAVDEVL